MTDLISHQTIPQALDAQAAARAAQPALIFLHVNGNEQIITFAQLSADIRRRAASLEAAGLRANQVVALSFAHGYEVFLTHLAAVYLGALPLMLPYWESDGSAERYRGQIQSLLGSVAPEWMV